MYLLGNTATDLLTSDYTTLPLARVASPSQPSFCVNVVVRRYEALFVQPFRPETAHTLLSPTHLIISVIAGSYATGRIRWHTRSARGNGHVVGNIREQNCA